MDIDDIKERARREAEELAAVYWPEGKFPVDPVRIASRMGATVRIGELHEDVSGAVYRAVKEDPVILINRKDSKARQRFTCAHELGHVVERSGDSEEFHTVDYRRQEPGTLAEVFANEFAACLLMPEAAVRSVFEDLDDMTDSRRLFSMAQEFGVSTQAMNVRLSKLGLRSARPTR